MSLSARQKEKSKAELRNLSDKQSIGQNRRKGRTNSTKINRCQVTGDLRALLFHDFYFPGNRNTTCGGDFVSKLKEMKALRRRKELPYSLDSLRDRSPVSCLAVLHHYSTNTFYVDLRDKPSWSLDCARCI